MGKREGGGGGCQATKPMAIPTDRWLSPFCCCCSNNRRPQLIYSREARAPPWHGLALFCPFPWRGAAGLARVSATVPMPDRSGLADKATSRPLLPRPVWSVQEWTVQNVPTACKLLATECWLSCSAMCHLSRARERGQLLYS